MKLRAHHIVCLSPLQLDLSERGAEYIQMEDRIKKTMAKGRDEIVEVVFGVDDLCHVCPLCKDKRCQSPEGDEESVRKWDALLLKRLGVPLDTAMPAHEWRTLIKQVFPIDFCHQRCSHSGFCERSGVK